MFRLPLLVKTRKRILLALVAALMVSGLALAPTSVASACGTIGGGSCPCPGC